MCGIAGIIGKEKNKDETIKTMVDCITHRGPDEDGFFSDEFVAFGMRRLSIIDLAGGHQPIENEEGNLSIVFNGEIYNFHELYDVLVNKGHQFKTKSDTEVLIHAYEEFGTDMLKMLRGMFAFSIYDKEKAKLFIARDYFGIKPLYYLTEGSKIIAYGSEIKSLLLHPKYKKEINEEAVFDYLAYQYNPGEETMFKNIWKLPPGAYMIIDIKENKIKEKKYWSFEFNEQRNNNEKDLKEEIFRGMQDSVRAHMIADVPVGGYLSGGIDSAAIIALMSKETDKKVSTFTVGFKEVSEHEQARQMAKHVGTDHNEITVSLDEYLDVLPKVVWHFDEPVGDPSAVGLYFLAREARKKVKVVLSGEGADELFGGYNIYREPMALDKMRLIPGFIKSLIIKPLVNSKIPFYGKNYLRRALTPIQDRYIGNANVFKLAEINSLWNYKPDEEKKELFSLKDDFEHLSHLHDSEKMQIIDINYWLVGDILQKGDKMSMAHSLELRVPYLDRDIAKIASTIPPHLKFKNGKTKHIFREAVKNIMPKATAQRKKLGFPTALKHWMRQNIKSFEFEIIENEYIKSRFKVGYIKHLLKEHEIGKKDNARKIYLLYMLALWHKTFFNK
jgi:asparagine synthase (glutamine-hydrolysing)